MLTIGPHMSIAKGFSKAAKDIIDMNANTFQFFSRNPRGSNYKVNNEKDIDEFQKIRKENHFGPMQAHAPYTMNLASEKDEVYRFAKEVIKEDIKRMDNLDIEYICFHPGSHVGGGLDKGIDRIIYGLNEGINGSEDIMILLETMPGKGTEVGYDFKHLKRIIDGVNYNNKLGICMDLCHVFSAGYDIKNNFNGVLEEFDKVIGVDRLKTIHLNDSMMPFGEKKDRHMPIGEGKIGLEAIINIMENPYIKRLPFYIETPLENDGHKREVEMIKDILSYS